MKNIWTTFAMACVMITGFNVLGFGEWENAVTVMVLDFNVPDTFSDDLPSTLAGMFQGALVNDGSFSVVERSLLQELLEEQELEMSGLTEVEAASKVGQIIGAQKIVSGTVSRIGDNYVVVVNGINIATGVIEICDQVTVSSEGELINILSVLAERFIQKALGMEVENFVFEESEVTDIADIEKEEPIVTAADILNVQAVIDDKNFLKPAGLVILQEESADLDYINRKSIYNDNRKSSFGGMVLNIIPSLGSWAQGDVKGALLIDAGLALSGVLFSTDSEVGMTIGGIVIGITYAYNLYRPYKYDINWNKSLKRGLNLAYSSDVFYPSAVALQSETPEIIPMNDAIIHLSLLSVEF